MYSATGTLIAKYTYDVWGNVLSVTNATGTEITASTHIANLQPFRYRSYYLDQESNFYYLQSRYYDPVTHRFINADGLVSTGTGILGHNMFTYCNNNPITRADDGGYIWNVVAGAVVGGITNLVTSFAAEVSDGNFSLKDAGKVFVSTVIGAGEGALIAAYPAAAPAISAISSMADSAIGGFINGDSLSDVVADSLVSGTIGAIAGSNGSDFVKGDKLLNNAVKSFNQIGKKGVHPIVKNTAKKTVGKAVKYVGKSYLSSQTSSFAYSGIAYVTTSFIKLVMEKISSS